MNSNGPDCSLCGPPCAPLVAPPSPESLRGRFSLLNPLCPSPAGVVMPWQGSTSFPMRPSISTGIVAPMSLPARSRARAHTHTHTHTHTCTHTHTRGHTHTRPHTCQHFTSTRMLGVSGGAPYEYSTLQPHVNVRAFTISKITCFTALSAKRCLRSVPPS